MKILTANIASRRRRVPQLVAAIGDHRPDVVVVTEAYHARWWLVLVRGYRLRQYSRAKGAEAPSVAVLVRRDHKVVQRWPMRMTRTWRAPSGRLRRPRVYPALALDNGARLLGMHGPTGGPAGPNAAAWAETWRRATGWLLRHDHAAAAGDWNALRGELVDQLPPGTALVVGTKVDHTVTTGWRHDWTKRLRPPEGMHGWVVYKLQRRP